MNQKTGIKSINTDKDYTRLVIKEHIWDLIIKGELDTGQTIISVGDLKIRVNEKKSRDKTRRCSNDITKRERDFYIIKLCSYVTH